MTKRTACEDLPAKRKPKISHDALPARPHTPISRQTVESLLLQRQKLPIWTKAGTIRQALNGAGNTLLLVGETGSGKSTQVPQFLLDEPWCRQSQARFQNGHIKVGGCIAITEPRRVAAISLARRVAEEMGTSLGSSSPASKVGYSVRFDNSTSSSNRIKFLTEGMLLQEMLRDPYLRHYSAVIVDEVHERGVNVDLILGFLQELQGEKIAGRGGIPLKIAVMSATADIEALLRFIKPNESKGTDSSDGYGRDDDVSEFEGFSDDQRTNETDQSNVSTELSDSPATPSIVHIEGRQYPVKLIYTPQPVFDFVDAALIKIFQIHHAEPLPGDILVFLTGQETIESLEKLVNQYAQDMPLEVPKLLVLPLFAALPQHLQQRVFKPTPPRTRKVILSTNIAETSVTVSGVRHVIDCGKTKIKQFRTGLGLDSLLVKPVSKSAAIQRMGRAGREAPGQCHRLYTQEEYESFKDNQTPEILRCDLAQAILHMKARGVDQVWDFPLLDKPRREAFEKALLQLLRLNALNERGNVSEIGMKIAKLPLSAPLGRVLVGAMEEDRDCLAAVIDIVSCLSVENLFLSLTSEEAKEKAEVARGSLYRREGDHLTLLATVQAYMAEQSDRQSWCEKHFISHRAMRTVMDVRKQLRSYVAELSTRTLDESVSMNGERSIVILKCFLQGFGRNVARGTSAGYKTLLSNQPVAIHPSSVLFGKKVEAIMYNEHVFTQKSYARGVSAVQVNWVGEV